MNIPAEAYETCPSECAANNHPGAEHVYPVIPTEAVEALACVLAHEALVEADMAGAGWDAENDSPEPFMPRARSRARAYLEAAAPFMLSHEREQTRLAHLDAMVNRETKRAELADAFAYGWREGKGIFTPVNLDSQEILHNEAQQPDWNPYKEGQPAC